MNPPQGEAVRRILARARDEARDRRHDFLRTEHVLLDLAADGGGLARAVLEALGVGADRLRRETEGRITPSIDRAPGRDVPTTPRLSRVLTLTVEEAAGFGQPHADTEHLLLGLLREP